MITLYQQIKTPISFWCKRGLNRESRIQLLEILPVELTEIHKDIIFLEQLLCGLRIYILKLMMTSI